MTTRTRMMSSSSNPRTGPAGSPQSSTFRSSSPLTSKRKSHGASQPPRKHEQHVVIQTPPRLRSLADDTESPGTTATMVSSSSPPTRTRTTTTMSKGSFSPKLSPISHASSTARQQEHREKQQDQREPPSPFSPVSRKQQQQEDQMHKAANEVNASSNDTQEMLANSQPELKTRVRESVPSTTVSPDKSSGNGKENVNDDDDDDDYVDLTNLFVFLQRGDWERVYTFLKQNPKSSRQAITSKKGSTSLLHIVLRHGPPLPVLDALLDQEVSRPSSLAAVFKQTDTNGRLPLHAACCSGPAACLDVVSRLISVDPDALQVPTRDKHGRYPLHLAVVTNASEEVVMELMIHFPDASFKPDSHGKLPIEYAQDACYGHNRLVVALEWAPMFLAASQAAFKRVAKATETKLNSLREAHASYEEQLENRYNGEKMELVREQIRCSNDLTNEKERNIALAEAVLALKKSEDDLRREKELLESKLERECALRNTTTKRRDEELKQILLGKTEKKRNVDGGSENEKKKESEEQTESSTNDKASVAFDASASKLPLPRLLKRLSEQYESSKRRNDLYKKSLERQRNIAKNLNKLLADKENDLQHANRKYRCNEITLQEALDRADDLDQKHQSALKQLSVAKEEVERLKKIDSDRERRFSHSQRRLKIQEKRLSGVQDLIDSLKAARAQADERLDFIQEEDTEQGSVSPIFEAGSAPLSRKPSAAELSLDLSVEIEMAAMAAAQLEDSSICTSPSARRREADLSTELIAVDKATPDGNGGNGGRYSKREPVTPESMLKRFDASNRTGTNNWEKNKEGKWSRGTPHTSSVTTATTASFGEDVFDDDSMNRSIPETPPVSKQVKSRSRQEYDQCSPLGTLKLDFDLEP